MNLTNKQDDCFKFAAKILELNKQYLSTFGIECSDSELKEKGMKKLLDQYTVDRANAFISDELLKKNGRTNNYAADLQNVFFCNV